jgi:hypothetical protein
MATQKRNRRLSAEERLNRALAQDDLIWNKRYRIGRHMTISFPNQKTVPLLGRFAIWILNKLGAETVINYYDQDAYGEKQ